MNGSRTLCLGNDCVEVTWNDAAVGALVGQIFCHVESRDGVPVHASLEIVLHDEAPQYELRTADSVLYRGDSSGMLAGILVNRVLFNIADRCRSGPMFHAAALSRSGATVLVPGKSGAGKTTLTAWLLHRGFAYLTDELVLLEPDSNRVRGFTRPLNLKQGSFAVLEQHTGVRFADYADMESNLGTLVPPAAFGDGGVVEQADVTTLLLPRYRADADFEMVPVPRARAAVALMECLVNAGNLDQHGLPEITRFARSVPAWELHYRSFDELDHAIERLDLPREPQSGLHKGA
jgi:hypothetical protein